ncbi:amino acid adenylation domain-containing protein [Microcoleus sp. B7-D4]|uniref:amino acid adenylation domain-containing protein n=1 Tax=Microcoleus sp. B7-D4 TaxID=2818696 RepID=UPI002FD6D2E6
MNDINKRIAELSPAKRALLEQRLKEKAVANPHQTISPRANQKEAPLSFAQTRMWLLDQLKSGNPAYNRPTNIRLVGGINVAVLEFCLNEIVRRHEVLRASFAAVDGKPVQVIAPSLTLTLPIVDISNLPSQDKQAKLQQLATEEAQRPFNLAFGSLVRANLVRLGEQEHILLLTLHHIIFDGWSVGVLLKELALLYEAFGAGKPSTVSELPIQYADFAYWQQQHLQGEVLESQLAYWRGQLGGDLPVLELPTDRARSPVQTFRGAKQSLLLPKSLTQSLKLLSQREGVTLFMTLLAAFKILLHRYTGQEDIVVGAPIAGRDRIETETLIGIFINTLVLRTYVDSKLTFLQLLATVRKVAIEAYEHQGIPFEKLVEELQPDRDLSHTPLFQVLFQLRNVPNETVEVQGLRFDDFQFDRGITAFDLTLDIVDTPEGLSCRFEYNTDLFYAATIVRMAGHFQTLLEGIVANVEQPIGQLPLLTETERHQLLVEWNNTQTDYSNQTCIHQLFEAQAKQTPNAVAVVFENEQLTYQQLNCRANQLAHHLQKLGVEPEMLVGICVERSLEMMVGLLGILKAGAAYLPLDPAYPKERLTFMLEDAQVPVLLTQQPQVEKLPSHQAKVVCLDTDWEAIKPESQENPISSVTADNLAYVMYTSGSTGRPKGVSVIHRGVVRLVKEANYANLAAEEVFLQLAPISFDASTLEIWGSLLNGARLVIFPPHTPSLEELGQVIQQYQITTLGLTTGLFHLMVDERLEDLKPLRQLLAGGDVLSVPHVQKFLQKIGDCKLINGYGPTENTTFTCCYPITEPDQLGNSVPIGRPITNTQVYVLDSHRKPVPIGVPGELYTGGDGLARGYLNRTELTAQKFIPNPFSDAPAARLYKTGDLARYLPDGNIEFLGRIDNQVKIRGFRIELGEIETVLRQNRAVQDAVVIDQEYDPGDKRLVAYVVPSQEQVLSTSELRRYLKEKLPDHMIPSAFVQLEALPLTPNGKVDRRALPVPDGTRSDLEETFVPHLTPFEELLAGIWSEVLRLEGVSIHDNFFELGGHSLLATQVISRVRKAFGVELPLHTLFEEPTLAGLAKIVEAACRAEEGSLQALPISPISREGDLPLSFAQQRLWFLDQLMSGTPLYNIPNAIGLKGSLNVTALEQSLSEIVRRHEALRTNFSAVNGQPIQIIRPAATLLLPIVDLRKLPETEREVEAQRLATEGAQCPFDLVNEPLFRVNLLHLGKEEHLLLLTMHHIVSDGWSLGVFMRELSVLYEAFSTEKSSSLPELPIQYADFAVWQNEWLVGEVLEFQLNYWKRHLGGQLPVLELPTDRPRPPVQTYRGARQSLELPKKSTDALKALSQQEGVTLFMTLLAVFQILLYRYTGQEDVIVGSPIANRNRVEIEGLIGFFVNTLVLRTELSGDPSFRELLGRVREVALGAYTHQDLPFEKLVEELQPERDLSRTPLFQVMFVFQNALIAALEFRGLSLTPLEVHNGTAKLDLTLALEETSEGIKGGVEYNTDLFEAATITRMVGHFQTLLKSIVANPEQHLSDLPLLTEAEQHQLLVEWNNTQIDYPNNTCIHQLFEAQVERTPNAVAVVFENEQLTYQELNCRANQLAHHLQKMGVEPEVTVGICLERSLEMLVALLAILKAGGAYIPLDPTYPQERLAFMLEDSLLSLLLTTSKIIQNSLYASGKVSTNIIDSNEQSPSNPEQLTVISLDKTWEIINRENPENPKSNVNPTNLAYILYTSGSTGFPKGVAIEHRSTVNFINWAQTVFNPKQLAGVLASTSICFDLSVFELFVPLSCGGKVILAQNALHLPTLKAAKDVTLINTVPSAIAELLRANAIPQNVQTVNLAGEPLSQQLVNQLYQQTTLQQVFNLYGPSEATTYSTFTLCIPRRGENEKVYPSPSIGRPIANTQIYILNSHLQPVPIGVPGELYIGGDGLARSYFNRQNLTEEKFIPNSFLNSQFKIQNLKGDRLYKTGDLARYLPDGNIEFLGRIDNQVKIRGFRIELGEVESTLSQYPTVQQCVVTARVGLENDKRLVAYIVSNQQQKPTTDELRCFLKQKLPDYMVPSAFVFLDTIPLTPNGKVDHRALPAPDQSRPDQSVKFVAPRTPIELQIADIWTQVLRLEQVGVHDNFFELGGHSLLATQVISRLRQAFGVELPLRTLFEAPTVADLGGRIETVRWAVQELQANESDTMDDYEEGEL